MMDLPVALRARPAVEYIPLNPEVLAVFQYEGPPSIEVCLRPSLLDGSMRDLITGRIDEPWPNDRVFLICRGFYPAKTYYRGHDVVVTCQPASHAGYIAAIETGFFYKEWLVFQVCLASGESLASSRWDVPRDIAIRRPPSSPGAHSSARRVSQG